MRSSAATLAALEIAIAGRCAPLASRQDIVVHRKTHRATGVAPFKTRILKYRGKAFLFGLAFDLHRTRDDHRADILIDFVSTRHFCGLAKVFDPRICTRANKRAVDGDPVKLRRRFEAHIFHRKLVRSTLAIGPGGRIRNSLRYFDRHFG